MCVFPAKSVVRLSARWRRVALAAAAASAGGAIYSGKRVSFILSSAPPPPPHQLKQPPARHFVLPEQPNLPLAAPPQGPVTARHPSRRGARDTTVVRRFLGKLCRARPSGPYAMPATGFVSQDPVAEKTEHGDVLFASE